MDKITSIESYLEWVRNCENFEVAGHTWQQDHLFFRGQAKFDWGLSPSVFRKPIADEHKLLESAFQYAWKYLQSYPTYLEKMIVLQHYGLRTRLLDLTSNPLIALFFACLSEKDNDKENDGKVFCYCANGEENKYYPQLIADIVMKNDNKSTLYDNFIKKEGEKIFGEIDFETESFKNWREKLCTPQFFLSPFNNNRITAQRGAFIIAPLCSDEFDNYVFKSKQIEEMECWHPTKAIIDANYKTSLLKELAMMGIDESTIYPDFEHLLSFLNHQYQIADDVEINNN